jgi:fructokinase
MTKPASTFSYGGIEAGGTKFVCAVGTSPENIRTTQFPTTTPKEAIGKAIYFFEREIEKNPLLAIGIASFGPIDLNTKSPSYGYITTTPKLGWRNTNIVGMITEALGIPIAFDTDVNLAALGEQKWGAAKGLDTFIYITVGTGIGGGGIINGQLMHGLTHSEMGHIRIPHNYQLDPFPGSCPFHKDCLEGLASGESMKKRWGKPPEEIPSDHPAWELEADYLAVGIANFICTLSPQRIIIGGGITENVNLLPLIRNKVRGVLNNYIDSPEIAENIEHYLVPPELGKLSGVLGAIAFAQQLR